MKDRHGHRWGPAVAVVLLLAIPLLYPLSLGPAILAYDALGAPQGIGEFLEQVYGPLLNLPEPVATWVQWYADLWGS